MATAQNVRKLVNRKLKKRIKRYKVNLIFVSFCLKNKLKFSFNSTINKTMIKIYFR